MTMPSVSKMPTNTNQIVQHASQIPPLFVGFFLNTREVRHVLTDAHHPRRRTALVFDFALRVQRSDIAVGADDAMPDLIAFAFEYGAVYRCNEPFAIVRVDESKIGLERRGERLLKTEDAVNLVRPEKSVRPDVPLPTAHLADALGLGEIGPADGKVGVRPFDAPAKPHGARGERQTQNDDSRLRRDDERVR